MKKLYVQYGCGLSAPETWVNFDVSPTLRIQKAPLVGYLFQKKLNVKFPDNVLYGDIIKSLPVSENSCDGVYCSHTLEHLALQDMRMALKNTFKILKKGGIFRCIVPDLEYYARKYIHAVENGDKEAGMKFMESTLMGVTERPRGLKEIIISNFGTPHHLWMWDHNSLYIELENSGFTQIRICKFNDCEDEMFKDVEAVSRFEYSVALESRK